MIRNLTVQQINDWFTIGKRISNAERLEGKTASSADVGASRATLDEPSSREATAAAPPPPPPPNRQEIKGHLSQAEYAKDSGNQEKQELVQTSHQEPVSEAGTNSSLLEKIDGEDLPTSFPVIPPRPVNTILSTERANYRYQELPISKHREQLVNLIENNSVVIVRGVTGSGKSTQLPQYILDHYCKTSSYCKIVVTQPRKIGAISIARWICRERRLSLGGLVGYQVGLEKETTTDTQLFYVTTGILLHKIVSAKCLTEFTHIFIDEVHERTEEMDFLLLVVRKLLRTNSRFIKVILMSATINCEEFADYFAVPFRNSFTPAYIFEVDGAPHNVEEYYLDDLKRLARFQVPPLFSNEPVITNLSFSIGIAEINYMHDVFTSMVQKRLHVYPLHSSVTLEEQNDAFLTPVPGYRKIILSTNIAESSITVPDVKYVIDFCLTRNLVCDDDTNYQSLRLSWASKASCIQRKGRAGRISKGYCYRLVTKDFWTHCIPDHAVPEMQRCPLGSTVLKTKLLDMGEPRALLASALSPPNLRDIERTVVLLKEVGALSIGIKEIENPYDGDLTFLGRVLAHLPVNLQLGKLVVLGHVFGCLEECLIIAAALSLKNIFAMPFKQHLEGYRNKMEFSGGTLSDCIAIVNAFKTWRTCREQGQLRFPRVELDWGKSNYIQIKRIKEVAQLYEELKDRIQKFDMFVDHHSRCMDEEYVHKQRFILQVVLAGAFYPNYFTFCPLSEETAVKELSGKYANATVVMRNIPPYGFLYYKQLQSLFRQCGQVKAISFDGSKCFVEFVQNPIKRTGIHPAVYMALKMAQLHIPLQLNVHPVEEIEALSQGQSYAGLHRPRLYVDYQNWTVKLMSEEMSRGLLELPCDPIPCFFTMNVTEVVEVGHFWGYRTDGESLHTLSKLMTEINQMKLTPLAVEPYPDVCLAPFTDCSETHYYRAKVLQVSGDSAEVFFVDYGNTAQVPSHLLRNISSQFLELPFQALQCQICCMRPSAHSLISGDQWSAKAKKRFISLVKDCVLLVKVFSTVHCTLRVDLSIQTSKGDRNVREVLISEGFAEPAEESYESKESHEQLKTRFQTRLQENSRLTQQNSRGTQTTRWTQKEEDWKVIQTIMENFSSSKLGLPSSKVLLHGPFNPYEIRFHSMTAMSRFRNVWIERESINSVALNGAPEDVHQRMLVAASVSVNASGSTIIVRETTLMPNIHGLPALICMIFAPVMELRTDRLRKSYTGALCGLGWNPTTNEALLEEHDQEVVFDVHLDVNDISEINLLRSTINKLVCDGYHGPPHYGNNEKTRKLQHEASQKLLDIFTGKKPRETIVSQYFDKPYKWNQVAPQFLLNQSEFEKGNKTSLYQLHRLVLLSP
uniref:ATP-dependent RNA helicase TDRD9 n=1 Tax=Callorhinchus milii TaxID=7868 RepID=A0A4W3IWU1_CALMI